MRGTGRLTRPGHWANLLREIMYQTGDFHRGLNYIPSFKPGDLPCLTQVVSKMVKVLTYGHTRFDTVDSVQDFIVT
jgi:hypothetical protein